MSWYYDDDHFDLMDSLKVFRDRPPLSSLIYMDHPLRVIVLHPWDQMAGSPLGVEKIPAE